MACLAYVASCLGIIFAASAVGYGLLEPHHGAVMVLVALTALNLSVAYVLRR